MAHKCQRSGRTSCTPFSSVLQCHGGGLAYSGNAFHSINEVTLRWARLVLWWVTARGQVNRLFM